MGEGTNFVTPEEAIGRVLKIESTIPEPWYSYIRESDGEQWFYYNPNQKSNTRIFRASDFDMLAEYRTLCPRLAKALKVAMEALGHYTEGSYVISPYRDAITARDALTAIEKVFE